jgi:hypothetical protein
VQKQCPSANVRAFQDQQKYLSGRVKISGPAKIFARDTKSKPSRTLDQTPKDHTSEMKISRCPISNINTTFALPNIVGIQFPKS